MKKYLFVVIVMSFMFLINSYALAGQSCCVKKSSACLKSECCVDGKCACKQDCCVNGVCKCAETKCNLKCNC